jgi:hypothetical protein
MTAEPRFTSRRIFKTAITNQNVVREVLQLMFVSELLAQGEETWLVSPWISNIVLLDNRAGGFDVINPEWRRREIRLVDVAVQILSAGGRVTVVSRPDEHNKRFLFRLAEAAREAGVDDLLTLIERDHLHTKGILTHHGLLLGSMNITYNGLELNDEFVEYDTDRASLTSARLAFDSYRNDAS